MNNFLVGFVNELEKHATEIKLYDSQKAYNLSRLQPGITKGYLDMVKSKGMEASDAMKLIRRKAQEDPGRHTTGYADKARDRVGVNLKGIKTANRTGYPASIESTIAHEMHHIKSSGKHPILEEVGARIAGGRASSGGAMTKVINSGKMTGRGLLRWKKYL